jgi:hypothetical protein
MSETPNTPQTPSDEHADRNLPQDVRITQTGTPGDGKGRVDVIGPIHTDTEAEAASENDGESQSESGNTQRVE